MHGPVLSALPSDRSITDHRSVCRTAAGARPGPGERLAHAVAAGGPSAVAAPPAFPPRSLTFPRTCGGMDPCARSSEACDALHLS